MALFTPKRAIPAVWAGWWGNPDQACPKPRTALEPEQRPGHGQLGRAQILFRIRAFSSRCCRIKHKTIPNAIRQKAECSSSFAGF